MKNIIQLLNKYFYELTFILLLFIALFNGFNNVGLWQDGGWCIYEMLQESVSLDYSRLFAHIALHVPSFFLAMLGLNNIESLQLICVLHGIWFYLLVPIVLSITYLILPKNKKHWFVFPLLCYLVTMVFTSYFIVSEMYITLYLFWLILMVFLFVDFRTISFYKQVILLVSCFILIRSYQVACLLSLLLLIIGLQKFYILNNQIPIVKRILFYICFLFLIASVAVNFYFILNPIDTNVSKVFDNLYVLRKQYFIYYFLFAVAVSLINYKKKYIKIAAVLLLAIVSVKFMLNNIELLKNAHDMRNFAPIFLFMFSFLLLFVYYLKKEINFRVWKIVCAVLLCLYMVNSIIFSSKINAFLKEIPNSLAKQQENIVPIKTFRETFPYQHFVIDTFVLPRQAIFSQILYFNDRIISKILVDESLISDKQNFFNVTNNKLVAQLKKFGIIYSDDLINEIGKLN